MNSSSEQFVGALGAVFWQRRGSEKVFGLSYQIAE
jgi:hypothetical protein